METETINLKEIPVEDLIKYLGEQKYIVRTEGQDNDYWDKKKDESIGKKLKEWSDNLDVKIKERTKIEKNDQENSLAYYERTLDIINGAKTTAEKELDSIRKTTADGNNEAAEIQKQFDSYKKNKEKEFTDMSGEINDMKSNAFTDRFHNAINEAMAKIRPTLKQDKDNDKMIQSAIENEITSFKNSVKAVDHQGGLIYHDNEDNPLIDKVNGNHLGAYDLLNEKLGYLIDESRVVGGSGANGKFNESDTGGNKFKLQLPDTVKTKVQLTEYLQKDIGLDPNETDFNKYFMENKGELSFR